MAAFPLLLLGKYCEEYIFGWEKDVREVLTGFLLLWV
jgi:hypothetical protein